MCRGFVRSRDIVADDGWQFDAFDGPIDENSRHSGSIDFSGGPAQRPGFARGRGNDNAIDSELEQPSGMIQFILDALVGITHDHLVTVSYHGTFDGAYNPGKKGIADVSNYQANGERGPLFHAARQSIRVIIELAGDFDDTIASCG
jgi:hypothetical protein